MPHFTDRIRTLLAAVGGVVVVAACDDSTGIRASFNNIETEPVVYAINGTAITLPNAVSVRSGSAVRVDAGFLFDLAFDINDTGVVELYTQGRVASQLVAVHRVGLQYSAQTYTATLRAPLSGYVYDSLLTLPVGKAVLVDVIEAACSGSFLGPNIRAKVRVDSVNLATRAIHLHVLSNPNCGFRSLVQGEPKD